MDPATVKLIALMVQELAPIVAKDMLPKLEAYLAAHNDDIERARHNADWIREQDKLQDATATVIRESLERHPDRVQKIRAFIIEIEKEENAKNA